MSDILTEEQLRAALIVGETENLISVVPANLAFCGQCGHYGDTRSGCEADIRFDERSKIREKLLAGLEPITVSTIWPDDYGPGTKVEPFVIDCDLRQLIDNVLPDSDNTIDTGINIVKQEQSKS